MIFSTIKKLLSKPSLQQRYELSEIIPPGTFVKVRRFVSLSLFVQNSNEITHCYVAKPEELLFIICVDLNPPTHPSGFRLYKPANLYFLNKEGSVVFTGTRSIVDVFASFEEL